ncbi:two-component system OmpR family sensor kinase [Saccharothrix saharensis]|uniref:histidine kinase n=1 Tax=Saccharothrix saharensis TaxID=571190 RepID=A0A543JAB0_9PSEU|nr:HAMP domain-containing sensor histidine kinase [Saccharothrix saharensis]TQM79756.1 two-component system OmpR family sensor kinase [Saccharothrix saharensis]
MSLRTRLVLTVVGLLALCLAVSVGAIFGALQDWTGDQHDDVLTAVGQDFRRELRAGGGTPSDGVVDRVWRSAAARGDVPSFFQVRGPDGRVRQTTAFGATPALPDPLTDDLWPAEVTEANPDGGRFADVGDWLVRTSRVAERGDVLVVGMPVAKSAELLDRVRNVAVTSGLVALAAVALLSLRAVRRALRPLEGISATAAAIGSGDLTRRVEGAGARTEVGRLGDALNAMLGQLESAFRQREASEDRLRRFVADASHELRTPIATIRGYAELFRRGAAGRPEDLGTALRRIESEAERMGSLVDELLLLARLDQGRPLIREPVELTDLAADAVADALTAQPAHPVELDYDGPVTVTGDADRLRQVLGNLLANVARHTPVGTRTRVRIRAEGGFAVLEVSDDGPGLSDEDRGRVFERFHRSAGARGGGAGLGLSIVAAVAEAHGGRAEVGDTPGGGATFVVTLPVG